MFIDTAITFGYLIGGIGVFLLAINFLTQGLQMVSSASLRRILERLTTKPLHGLMFGATVTAFLQSSSAVTAITIGFVNAAILSLQNGIWVIFGANVGTTMTGWLVSIIGFQFDIKALALPLVGIGMFMRTFGKDRNGWRFGALGTALVGFGLFFIGIDFLKSAFEHYAVQFDIQSIGQTGILSLMALVGAGFLMTLITQSSSAAMALILTGTAGGMLDLSGGAAMIIGANLGTTSTAVLAVLGATDNAKRLAAAHVMFNAITAIIALILLPALLVFVVHVETLIGMTPSDMTSLAFFHTTFNLLGIIVVSPFVAPMTSYLEKRFSEKKPKSNQAAYLDASVLEVPALALDALIQELIRMKGIACQNALDSLSSEMNEKNQESFEDRRDMLSGLSIQIADFSTQLSQRQTTLDISKHLRSCLKISRYLHELGVLAGHIQTARKLLSEQSDRKTIVAIECFIKKSELILIDMVNNNVLSRSAMTDLIQDYRNAKETALDAGIKGKISADTLSRLLDYLSTMRRMMEQAIKAQRNLFTLQKSAVIERA